VCAACDNSKGDRIAIRLTDERAIDKTVKVCVACARSGIRFKENIRILGAPAAIPKRLIKLSKKGEEETAKEIGGRTTLASGAIGTPGDVVNEDWMIEEKRTEKKSFRLTSTLLDKARSDAIRQGREWAIRIKMPDIGHDIGVTA